MAIFNILLLVLCTVSLSFAKPPTNQPINQSTHQSLTKHDSIDQSINQSINQSPYVEWADQAFKIFMSSLYNSETQMLRASVNSADPSQYWNTAVAFQSLLHYHNLKASINQPTDQSINHDQSIEQPSLMKGEGSIDQSINDDQSLNDENVVIPLIYQLIDSQTTLGVKLGQCDAQLRNNYNDDMSWMIHGLTALYDVTGNKSLINRSVDLHMFIRLSEDTTCCGDMKGGIWWDRTHTQKATAAQAGAALTGLRLMESKADKFSREEWIDWSIAHYDFWLNHMVNQTNYAVCDNINTDGDRRWWSFTYNEGLMLGVAVHLYRATNDSRFLSDADRLIGRLIDTSINVSINGRKGRVLASDGENCSGDTCQFKQVAFQYSTEYYRLLLDLTNPSINQPINQSINQSKLRVKANELYQFLQDNIDSLTTNAYNATTRTFNCDWSRQFDPSIKGSINGLQGTMNGAISSISLFAGLPTPPKLNKLEQMLMKTE